MKDKEYLWTENSDDYLITYCCRSSTPLQRPHDADTKYQLGQSWLCSTMSYHSRLTGELGMKTSR